EPTGRHVRPAPLRRGILRAGAVNGDLALTPAHLALRTYILPADRLDLTAGGRRSFCGRGRVRPAVTSMSTTPSPAATTIAIMSAQPLARNAWIIADMAERPLTPQCGVGRSCIGPKSNSIPVPACRSVDGEVTPLRARRRWRQSVGSPVVQLFHVIITGL